MARSVLAVAAAMAALIVIVFGTIFLLFPDLMAGGAFPTSLSGITLILTIEVAGGAAAAFLAALLAPRAPAVHGWVVGGLVLVLDVLSISGPDSLWPLVPGLILVGFVPVQTWAGIVLAGRFRGRAGRALLPASAARR